MKSLIEIHTPELWKAYTSFAEKATEESALSLKFKELLAVLQASGLMKSERVITGCTFKLT